MRQIALIIVACCLCLAAHAQLNRDVLNSYLEDVRTYEQAVNDIVKDGRYQNGISAMTDLISALLNAKISLCGFLHSIGQKTMYGLFMTM